MAANHLSPNLIVIMDCLWFQQAILFSEPLIPKPTTPQTLDLSSTSIPSPIEEESLSIASSPPTSLKVAEQSVKSRSPIHFVDDRNDDHDTEEERNDDNKIIKSPKSRQRFTKSKRRSHSTSGSLHKLLLSRKNSIDIIPTSLKKCMSWVELEHEELKGFMDLGFTFKKEELNPRMMSVIPGLQRLGKFHEEVEEFPRIVEEGNVIRPYLSEAWLINKPNSPLLNLRLPRVLGTDEMKKHLRYWARSVASAAQLEY